MIIKIPELSLVVLVGASGSGKSSFARKHFKPTEVLSSDYYRGLVADDENSQEATSDAFEVLHFIARKRLKGGFFTVVDATNVQVDARKPLVALAREMNALPVAIVLNLGREICHYRNKDRTDRNFGPHVVRQQCQQLKRSLRSLKREGFRHITILNSIAEIEEATIERVKLWNDLKHEKGAFDIISDVHGCAEELEQLLGRLGYIRNSTSSLGNFFHPDGRRAIFLGDLVDRGPSSPHVLRLVMDMVEAGKAFCVMGNHDSKLLRKLRGKNVRITHGLAETLKQIEVESDAFRERVMSFIDGLVSHYVFDGGKLVVAHAGLKEEHHGRASKTVREFALYGETTGEIDEFGLPVRHNWAADYRGKALVVYGHTPIPEATWTNRTVCIDTGCVFGGDLTALRYPEKEIVSVPAAYTYYEPVKPLVEEGMKPIASDLRPYNDLLDIQDVCGKRVIATRFRRSVTIQEENATAALEVMSRFAVDPRWLVYLPPTMSPTATAKEGPNLEQPNDAFSYYRTEGVPKVICEEKHMGSRAILVLCRDNDVAKRKFGVDDGRSGVAYTRTGRPFFSDSQLEYDLIERVTKAITEAGLWDELNADWVCIDAELMPWSAKAQELLRTQYASVGASSRASIQEALVLLQESSNRDDGMEALRERFVNRLEMVQNYVSAYRRYCWSVTSIADLKLAPFHLLASNRRVHTDRDHIWHMDTLARICEADSELLLATPYLVIDVTDPESQAQGTRWWEELTQKGGEGMVVKPLDWVVKGKKGLVQPAVKCRGREYLRIIYGPEYTAPEHIERLRSRGLGRKRALAIQEFTLGLEALHRFVEEEPLYRVHECVFGILALESEPIDPRL